MTIILARLMMLVAAAFALARRDVLQDKHVPMEPADVRWVSFYAAVRFVFQMEALVIVSIPQIA